MPNDKSSQSHSVETNKSKGGTCLVDRVEREKLISYCQIYCNRMGGLGSLGTLYVAHKMEGKLSNGPISNASYSQAGNYSHQTECLH